MGVPATPRPGESSNLRNHNARREIQGIETSAKVWELKKAGLSFRQIAAQLDMSQSGVHEAYKRVIRNLKDELAENADDWLHLQIGRLEEVVSFQIRVMRGMDVRPKEVRGRRASSSNEDMDPEEAEREESVLAYPTIEERLAAARDVVKSGESLRKMLGIDAPERSDVNVRGVVGTVDLTELAGPELEKETKALVAGLRTLSTEAQKALVAGDEDTIDSAPISEETVDDNGAQPKEV